MLTMIWIGKFAVAMGKFWAYPCGPGYPFIRLQALGARAGTHCYPLRVDLKAHAAHVRQQGG